MAPLIAAGLNIILFLGTVRQPRNADRVLKLVKPALEARNITVTIFGKYFPNNVNIYINVCISVIIDPLELHFDKVVKPIQYYNTSVETPPKSLLDLQNQLKNADGF